MADATRAPAVLGTKFAVPLGPRGMVARPRLLDALDAGVQGALTLVAAPPGAGKSALLSSWIAEGRPKSPVAWVSLDADDADRRRFWSAVIEALARVTGDERVGALAVSRRERLDLDALLPALVDAIDARGEPVVLVLDDFHEVSGVLKEDLERLTRFPAQALRLVLVTRADPPIGLARLRLDGRMTEIRAADLAFTLGEAGALFAALGVELAADDVATLWRRTEGWAAGLRLAAVSLLRHPEPAGFIERFAGTDASVSDYLVSEVLARQPPPLRDFLLRTSIVDVLSAELADALTCAADGQEQLATLERSGALMAPLDEHGPWHRYHPLFAELLRAELRAQLPHEVPELHRRAAGWMAAHDDVGAALRHAAAGGAWDLAAELTTGCWMQLLIDGETRALRPVLAGMPRERVEASPELALAFAGALLARGDHASAAAYLRRAAANEALVAPERRTRFAAGMAAVGLYQGRLRGDLDGALRKARKLLRGDLVVEGASLSAGFRAFVLAELGIVELWAGDLEAATGHLERAQAAADDDGGEWTRLVAMAHLALARTFQGKTSRALRHAQAAHEIAERSGWERSEPAGAAYSVQAAVCIGRGRSDEAAGLVVRAGEALRCTREWPLAAVHALNRVLLLADGGEADVALDVLQAAREGLGGWPLLPALDGMFVAQEGLLRAAVGDRAGARRLLEDAAGHDGPEALPVAGTRARLALLDGDPAAARAALAPHLGPEAELAGIPVAVHADAWLVDALACDALADHEAAATSLERALDLADPVGLRRLLVSQGRPVLALLHRQLRRGTAHPAMVHEAIAALERRASDRPAPVAVLLAEPLSEREQAILRYLPTMMSNQEIAGELYVSVNTIKTHLKAIYRKLDAPGRRDAVRRARDLGLMS